jgi:hypothetical protein
MFLFYVIARAKLEALPNLIKRLLRREEKERGSQ